MNKRLQAPAPIRLYLAEWRDFRGLSQEQLAERVGTSKASISRWENYERDMTAKGMVAVAAALGLEPVQLFRHPDDPPLDDLLAGISPKLRKKAIALVKTFLSEEADELRPETAPNKLKH